MPGLITKSTCQVAAVYFNPKGTPGRNGPRKTDSWSVMLADGGRLAAFSYRAIAHLIPYGQPSSVFPQAVSTELFIEARPAPGGPIIVSDPYAIVAPGQPLAAVPPAGGAAAPPYNPNEAIEGAVHGNASTVPGNVREAVTPRSATPVASMDVREREFAWKQATDILKSRAIACSVGWNVIGALGVDPAKIEDGSFDRAVDHMANFILSYTAGTPSTGDEEE